MDTASWRVMLPAAFSLLTCTHPAHLLSKVSLQATYKLLYFARAIAGLDSTERIGETKLALEQYSNRLHSM